MVAAAGSSRSNTASEAAALAFGFGDMARGAAGEPSGPALTGALSADEGPQPAKVRRPMAATGRMRMKFSQKMTRQARKHICK
jgi:hypothetical protein